MTDLKREINLALKKRLWKYENKPVFSFNPGYSSVNRRTTGPRAYHFVWRLVVVPLVFCIGDIVGQFLEGIPRYSLCGHRTFRDNFLQSIDVFVSFFRKCYNFLKTSLQVIERFSIECRKTKTKVIALTNHNRRKQFIEPIRTRSKDTHTASSARKRVRTSLRSNA